jgi:hypothetical protein
VFEEYDEKLHTVFKYFSKKAHAAPALNEDVTLVVTDVLNLLSKCKLLDTISQEEAIFVIEQFYARGSRL